MKLWSLCNVCATKRWALAACVLTSLTVSAGFAQEWVRHDSNWVPVKVRKKSIEILEATSESAPIIISKPAETHVSPVQLTTAKNETTQVVEAEDVEVNFEVPAPPESKIEPAPPATTTPEPAPFPGILKVNEDGCLGGQCDSACAPENSCPILDAENCVDETLLLNDQSLCEMRGSVDQFELPARRRWIFWKDECRTSEPRPICCSLQERTVNWRHSSMYLDGCIPEGYTLSCFIETVNHADFHGTPLASNGPADPGGSIVDAKATEGEDVKSLQQISINIAPPEGKLPPDRAAEKFKGLTAQAHVPGTHRLWNGTSYYWNASLLNHQPLYFEDVNLERHGFSRGCWQPFVSGAKFFGRLPALPYLMAAEPPHETQYTLGETRPGNHACYVCEHPPFSWKAVAVQGAATTGLVFLIP